MNKERFLRLLNERILILDGGMGTMIQSFKLNEQDYRGERFADFPGQLKGNNDLLCITRPDVIQSIHRQYLDAGADIFATNTFNANAISMADYAMEAYVREINLAAGRLSREVADTYMAEHPDRTIFVAGSIGPTNKTASMSPDVSDPAYRAVTYKDLYNAYKEQVEGLVDGGVDIILFETTFDTLNVKAGLEAAEVVLKEKEKDLPIMLSLTLSAQGGRSELLQDALHPASGVFLQPRAHDGHAVQKQRQAARQADNVENGHTWPPVSPNGPSIHARGLHEILTVFLQ